MDTSAGWVAVGSIALGTFAMVTSEFLPIGLLSAIAHDLGVSEGHAGMLLSMPGITAAFAAPLLTVQAGKLDRRLVLLALSLLVALADLVTAFAPTLGIALLGRMVLGTALGGFWAFAAAAGRRLVAEQAGHQATALILGGISVGTVLGVPLGTWIGGLGGWRGAFEVVALLAGLVLIGQLALLPALPSRETTRFRDLLSILAVPSARLGFAAAALIAGGHFAAYAYLQPFLASIHLPASQVTLVLAGYGIAGVIGTWAGARLAARNLRLTFAGTGLAIAAAIAFAFLAGAHAWISVGLVMLWGAAFGALPVCVQIWTYEAAPDRFETGSALTVTVFQTAVAAGALTGGIAVDHVGVWLAYLIGSLWAALAGLLLLARARPPV